MSQTVFTKRTSSDNEATPFRTASCCLAVAGYLLMSSICNAAFYCTGQVAFLGVSNGGEVHISNGFGVWSVCNISSVSNGIAIDTCKTWYASFLSAQKAGSKIRLYFNNANGTENGSQCSAIGSWVSVGATNYYMEVLSN